MKLFSAPTSPFARKIRVVALETGLGERLAIHDLPVSPVDRNGDLALRNPLAKIPSLEMASGETFYDSRVITEVLDSLHTGTRVIPEPGPARFQALRRQALADGAMDAAVLVRYETVLRPQELRWPDWIAGQKAKITGALDVLEGEADHLMTQVTIGEISIACLLGYLDLRFPEEAWRAGRPKLAAFADIFFQRPSMIATKPA